MTWGRHLNAHAQNSAYADEFLSAAFVSFVLRAVGVWPSTASLAYSVRDFALAGTGAEDAAASTEATTGTGNTPAGPAAAKGVTPKPAATPQRPTDGAPATLTTPSQRGGAANPWVGRHMIDALVSAPAAATATGNTPVKPQHMPAASPVSRLGAGAAGSGTTPTDGTHSINSRGDPLRRHGTASQAFVRQPSLDTQVNTHVAQAVPLPFVHWAALGPEHRVLLAPPRLAVKPTRHLTRVQMPGEDDDDPV